MKALEAGLFLGIAKEIGAVVKNFRAIVVGQPIDTAIGISLESKHRLAPTVRPRVRWVGCKEVIDRAQPSLCNELREPVSQRKQEIILPASTASLCDHLSVQLLRAGMAQRRDHIRVPLCEVCCLLGKR